MFLFYQVIAPGSFRLQVPTCLLQIVVSVSGAFLGQSRSCVQWPVWSGARDYHNPTPGPAMYCMRQIHACTAQGWVQEKRNNCVTLVSQAPRCVHCPPSTFQHPSHSGHMGPKNPALIILPATAGEGTQRKAAGFAPSAWSHGSPGWEEGCFPGALGACGLLWTGVWEGGEKKKGRIKMGSFLYSVS